MTDQRDADRELSDFWNKLIETGRATPSDLDPADIELIQRLNALANAPLPVSARERVWRGLVDTYVAPVKNGEQTMLTATELLLPNAGNWNGRIDRIRLSRIRPGRSLLLARPVVLAVVAALVLGLISGIGAAWRFTSWGDSEPTRSGPAIYAPGTPSVEATRTDELVAGVATPTAATTDGLTPAVFEGTWLLTATIDGQITRHVISLTTDGVAVVNGMPVVPLPGGESGAAFVSTGVGAWERSSSNSANVTYVRYRASSDGQSLGSVTVSMNITAGIFNPTSGIGTGVTTITDVDGNTLSTIVFDFSLTKLFAQAPVMPDQNPTPTP